MKNFSENYKREFKKEALQFLFLCDKRDGNILLNKNSDTGEFVRLACIALALSYKKMFLKIVATAEKNFDEFFKELADRNDNFELICKWTNEFIENIENSKAKELVREYWRQTEKKLDRNNFTVKQLLFL